MRRRTLIAAMILLFALAASASAVGGTSLAHRCGDDYGAGSWGALSYDGATTCVEADALVVDVTRDGRAAPRVGRRTGRTPHGTWRCETVRRREQQGDAATTHRTTCTLDDPAHAARVRFFALYE